MFNQSTIMPNRYKIIKINHKIGILFFTQPMTYFSSGLPLQIIKTFQSTKRTYFNTFIFSNKFINKIFQPGRKNDSSKAAGRLPGTSSSRQLSDRNCSRINQPPCWYPEWQPSPLAAVSRSVFYKPETKLYSPSTTVP